MENAAGPTILKTADISQAASQISRNPKGFFKRNLIIIVILVLIIAVLAEVIFGAFSLLSPSSTRNLNILSPKINELSPARLSLIPEKSVYKKGETVNIDVKLYTGGYSTASTDLAVKYDPAFLSLKGDAAVSVGQIYPEYPPIQVIGGQGLIGISGINFDQSQTFSGVGMFAKLNFTALKDGETEVIIDYQPDSTGDSNVVLASSLKDILGGVDNAKIIIGQTTSAGEETDIKRCGSFTQYCQDLSGKVGTQVCNAGTMNNNSCGYHPRVTMSCEECKI